MSQEYKLTDAYEQIAKLRALNAKLVEALEDLTKIVECRAFYSWRTKEKIMIKAKAVLAEAKELK